MGKVHTKRGAVAAAFLKDLLSKRADQLKPGDAIQELGFTNGGVGYYTWYTVNEIKPDDNSGVRSFENGVEIPRRTDLLYISGTSKKAGTCGFCGIAPDKMYRVAADAASKQAAIKQALDFQDTLTKAGTVRKNKGSK